MKKFETGHFIQLENPTPGESYRPQILTSDDDARTLGGMFGLLVPGTQVPYHYHKNRESVILFISGEGIEVIEGREIPIKAGDVLFIPANERHTTKNTSDKDLRYLEFFTCPPATADFIEVKE